MDYYRQLQPDRLYSAVSFSIAKSLYGIAYSNKAVNQTVEEFEESVLRHLDTNNKFRFLVKNITNDILDVIRRETSEE
jgi:hypothetical protein